MSRGLNDEWVRLALIRETLKRHGSRKRLSSVKKQIHRFLAELLWIKFRQNATSNKPEIWKTLLKFDPILWKSIYNSKLTNPKNALDDDPVPQAIMTAIPKLDLEAFAQALQSMPVRTSSDPRRLRERIRHARQTLRTEEKTLWKHIISTAKWRSPLLIMDEAHHLKNPGTLLARQLQSKVSDNDLRVGDGALSKSFDRITRQSAAILPTTATAPHEFTSSYSPDRCFKRNLFKKAGCNGDRRCILIFGIFL